MDRAALTGYLATEYDTLLAEAGIADTDTPDGLAPVLDAVAAIADADPALSLAWVRALGRYYALTRIVNRLAVNIDISTGGDSYRTQQQFANASKLLEREAAAVAWLVTPDAGTAPDGGVGTIVTIGIPYLTGGEAW